MTTQALNANHIRHLLKTTKTFDRVLNKLNIISLTAGKCVAECKVDEEHCNMLGGLHGGYSATLVDCVSTYALMSLEKGAVPNVSVDIHMSYLKGARNGDDIVIDASVVRSGKTLAFLEVLITNKVNGDVLVKGSHTKYLMQPK